MKRYPTPAAAESGTLTSDPLLALAAEIDAAHDACVGDQLALLESAKRCGELCLQAKALIKHGSFTAWLETHCRVGVRQARRYMTLARDWDLLKTDAMSDLTVTAAVKEITLAKLAAKPTPYITFTGQPCECGDPRRALIVYRTWVCGCGGQLQEATPEDFAAERERITARDAAKPATEIETILDPPPESLSDDERQQLAELERAVDEGLSTIGGIKKPGRDPQRQALDFRNTPLFASLATTTDTPYAGKSMVELNAIADRVFAGRDGSMLFSDLVSITLALFDRTASEPPANQKLYIDTMRYGATDGLTQMFRLLCLWASSRDESEARKLNARILLWCLAVDLDQMCLSEAAS